MRNLLWIGDAVVSSGFARSTHHILDTVKKTWDVSVLGLNYRGDPHKYDYPIYPCYAHDLFGVGRVKQLVDKLKPSVVVVQNDPWNFPAYLAKTGNVPVVGIVAVDGKNCRGRGLNGLAYAVFWTEFGMHEAQKGGYAGRSAVIPLGVDLNVYKPIDRLSARRAIGLPEYTHQAFIVGNVNRNQPRKRFDLCIQYFAEWIQRKNIDDAYLYFHSAPTGDLGYDLAQLAQYYGISNRLILTEPEIGFGVSEEQLAVEYGCFDVMLSTTQGEGFGLTTLEGMACGVPQIVPDWAALGELCAETALLVPCTATACTPNGINALGGIMDKAQAIAALDAVYQSQHGQLWSRMRERGLALAAKEAFQWSNIGRTFEEVLRLSLFPED